MKETATSCSISCKKKLQLFSVIAILLITAVVWSNQTKSPDEDKIVAEEIEEIMPFSNGPSSPPEDMIPPSEPPPA